ncbi:hypothetical protein EET67_09875 [Pseudaminobacter arsenicus]|uniref:DUF3168 domain-containing protein n=1 Tax=Borborobacter arsenicus TaxID=1851146 RepID=A0A432V754_9HYPH|nr:phage tail terminator-like protein [Pseudaminobacter arsenicus]RUM97913.1 hypothetical protein EET67_09875 [Pseudaminobacter arsenicus]
MSSATAFNTIEQYLKAQWTATPLVFENEPHDLPDQPAHWVFVEVFGDTFEQASIGADGRDANLWRETGQIYINVMTERDIGTGQARAYAEQLASLFRGLDIGTLTFGRSSIGAGEPGIGDGNYWRMTVTIDWERDQ